MTTYNTYQEAKLAMPLACIIEDTDSGLFFGMPTREGTTLAGGSRFAEPQYYCISMLTFSELGHKLVDGDVYQNEYGRVFTVGNLGYEARYCNLLSSYCFPSKIYILRAAALENQMNIDNLATQTPEEKEALDLIDTTPHQYEMSKFKSNPVIQLSIDEIDKFSGNKPRTKVEYEKWNFECAWHAIKAFEDGEKLYTKRSHKDFILIDNAQDVIRFLYSIYERIEYDESPQQREERERLESAYDLYCEWCIAMRYPKFSFEQFTACKRDKAGMLAIVDKTNYRKESN